MGEIAVLWFSALLFLSIGSLGNLWLYVYCFRFLLCLSMHVIMLLLIRFVFNLSIVKPMRDIPTLSDFAS